LVDKVKAKHAQVHGSFWAGYMYLSDIIGLPMYFERGFEGGLSVYGTLSPGLSQLESYHRWLRACMSGSRLYPELFVVLETSAGRIHFYNAIRLHKHSL